MANEITNTEANVLIPELWRSKMLEGRYAAMKIGKRVLSVDGDVSAQGDILHIQIEPTVSVNNVGSSGSVTNQALTPTEAQLTVDKWKECTITVVDKAQKQSIVDLLTAFTPAFGKAMGAQIDTDLAALYTDITNTVGNTSAPLQPVDEDMLVAAVRKLLDANVPIEDPNDISFAFHTSMWGVLKKIPAFNHANLTGKSEGGQLTVPVPDLYGIPVLFSTTIASTGTPAYRNNLLFHKQAFAFGMQKNFNVETLARVSKATPVSGDALYGVKTVRADHACILATDAS